MVSPQQTTPVAAPLAAPEDACQRTQANYTQPIPRARKMTYSVSRQTQAAQQAILNWIRNNKPDDVIAKFGHLRESVAGRLARRRRVTGHHAGLIGPVEEAHRRARTAVR